MLKHEFPSPVQPSRVVVLGARGFVAGALIGRLNRQAIPCRPVGRAEVDLVESSASDSLRRILQPGDSIVFTSALTPEHGRDRATFLKNVAMADHLCAVLAEVPNIHVVYVSSDSVYAPRDGDLDEDSPCESGDLYALSHIVREKLLAESCSAAGAPLLILRPTAIYGATDTHNSYGPNRFLRSALGKGTITLFGEGEEERDHIYIGDVTRLIELCLEHRSTGVLNLASGAALSFRTIARGICGMFSRPLTLATAPRQVPIAHRRFQASNLRRAFPNFEPTPFAVGIQEVMREFSGSGPTH